MTWRIPFNRPTPVGAERDYVQQALGSGHFCGDGPWTRRCQALLENELGVPKALLTTSCTHALEMAALLLELRPDDEVIVPSFAFVTTVNAFVLHGARPVFVDIRPDTLNLDETKLAAAVTSRTRAIVVLHYAGVGCEMDPILDLARGHGIAVIEDNAHGLFGKYRGRELGTFGSVATLSFHETKNFTCGEGGAVLINDSRLIARAEVIREKGTDRSRFFRGEVDKYTWMDLGSSYLPSDLLSAVLFAQLEERQKIQARRRELWEAYSTSLGDWAEERGVVLPTVPAHCESAHHIFHVLMPSLSERQALIDRLKAKGILSVFHYLPLHLSEMGRRFGGASANCPVTEEVSDRLLRLPFFNSMIDSEQADVIAAIRE